MQADVKKLKEIYKTELGKAIFDFLSTYRTNRKESTAVSIFQGLSFKFSEFEIRGALKEMAAAGAGTYIVGKNGGKSRIRWNDDGLLKIIKSLGREAQAETKTEKLKSVILRLTPREAKQVIYFLDSLDEKEDETESELDLL